MQGQSPPQAISNVQEATALSERKRKRKYSVELIWLSVPAPHTESALFLCSFGPPPPKSQKWEVSLVSSMVF